MNLKESVKHLPSSPGVYLMKDSLNNIIYVGKSKNLKNRVGSYFHNSKFHSPKVIKLVQNLKHFEYISTDTEFEAFLLECELIKKFKPRYNKLMKSPKSYSYIEISLNEAHPSIDISNEPNINDEYIYFGPYTNKNSLEKSLQCIKKYYKILCNNNSQKSSSCINYSLGICIGMCLDGNAKEQYLSILNKIINLLNGTDKGIVEEMESKMLDASNEFDFETAAKYRDYMTAVKYLIKKISVVEFIKNSKNIVVVEYLSEDTLKLFLINGYNVLFKEKYCLTAFNLKKLNNALIHNILLYFSNDNTKAQIEISRDEIDESHIIYTYLKSKSNNCKHIIIPSGWLDSSSKTSKLSNAIYELLHD